VVGSYLFSPANRERRCSSEEREESSMRPSTSTLAFRSMVALAKEEDTYISLHDRTRHISSHPRGTPTTYLVLSENRSRVVSMSGVRSISE
jgi:hypothetical protein